MRTHAEIITDINNDLYAVMHCKNNFRCNVMVDYGRGKLDAYKFCGLITDKEYCKYLDCFTACIKLGSDKEEIS